MRRLIRYGFHLALYPRKWKHADFIESTEKLGCNFCQVFAGNPRGWSLRANKEKLHELGKRAKEKGIGVLVHTGYLVNLASSLPGGIEKSIRRIDEEIEAAHLLGSDYIVVHMGKPKNLGKEEGIRLMIEALKLISKDKRKFILLENTAGAGSELGASVYELKSVLSEVEVGGICFDTAHAYAAGIDVADVSKLKEYADFFRKYVKVIHLNDTARPFKSHVDRHALLKNGYIGSKLEDFVKFCLDLSVRNFVVELPSDDFEEYVRNAQILKEWLGV